MAAVIGVLPLHWALVVFQIRGGQAVSLSGIEHLDFDPQYWLWRLGNDERATGVAQ